MTDKEYNIASGVVDRTILVIEKIKNDGELERFISAQGLFFGLPIAL